MVGPVRASREDIVAFAEQFDPQPMHLDEEWGRKSLLGGLAGSGWHMASLTMRMLSDGLLHDAQVRGVRMVNDLRWLSPFFPDEDVMLLVETGPAAGIAGGDDLGEVLFRLTLIANGDRKMLTMDAAIVLARRAGASLAGREGGSR